MIVLDFFRDFFSGIIYWLYVLVGIFAFFYVLGIVADRKRLAIANKLKEKKTYDIESGREAAIAAMESKQILDVEDETLPAANETPVENQSLGAVQNQFNDPLVGEAKKEEVPQVMVLNSGEQEAPQKQAEPVVISMEPSTTPAVTPVQVTPVQVTPVQTDQQ